jgi:hypothetical protein
MTTPERMALEVCEPWLAPNTPPAPGGRMGRRDLRRDAVRGQGFETARTQAKNWTTQS